MGHGFLNHYDRGSYELLPVPSFSTATSFVPKVTGVMSDGKDVVGLRNYISQYFPIDSLYVPGGGELLLIDITADALVGVGTFAGGADFRLNHQTKQVFGGGVSVAPPSIYGQLAANLIFEHEYQITYGKGLFENSAELVLPKFKVTEFEARGSTRWASLQYGGSENFITETIVGGTVTIENTSGFNAFFMLRDGSTFPDEGGTVTLNVTASDNQSSIVGIGSRYDGSGYFSTRYSDYEALQSPASVGTHVFSWGPDDYIQQPTVQIYLPSEASITFDDPVFVAA